MGKYDLVPFDVEKPDNSTAIVKTKVPEGLLRPYVQNAITYYQTRAKVPGFRSGHIPDEMIVSRYGNEIHSDVINAVVPELYSEALDREKLKTVGEPRFEIDWPGLSQAMTITMTFSLRPSLVIADYREIKLSRPEIKVTEEEVGNFLKSLQYENAELSPPVERAAQIGDIVTVYFNRQRPPVVKEKRLKLIVADADDGDRLNTMMLQGLSVGQEGEVAITYPEDYQATALAGATINYTVLVEEVRERILPEIDDAFAQDLGAENLDELKKRLHDEIRKDKETRVEESLLEQAWRSVLIATPMDISQSMVKRFMEDMLAEGAEMPQEDSEGYKEFYSYTESRLRDFFLTEAVIANEGISVTPEEIAKEKELLERLVKNRQITPEDVPDDEELERRMLRRQARERVKERVKIS